MHGARLAPHADANAVMVAASSTVPLRYPFITGTMGALAGFWNVSASSGAKQQPYAAWMAASLAGQYGATAAHDVLAGAALVM